VTDDAWDAAAANLYRRFQAGDVSPDGMVAELPRIWRHRSRADPLNSMSAWRAMVDHTGGYFTWASGQAEGRRASRPILSRRLFRGATVDRRCGMSWTARRGVAEDFARYRQPDGVEDGQVWIGVFEPSRLLAYFEDEREFLVDAVGVDILPLSAARVGRLLCLRPPYLSFAG
jgi:hypothetical protein